MTSIKWPTADLTGLTTGLTTGITGGLRTDGQPTGTAGVLSGVQAFGEFQQADAGARRLRLGNSLAFGLDSALRRLNLAASSFTWPAEGIPFATNSRLTTQPAASRADLGVTLPDGSGYAQEDKLLSRGFAAAAATTLAPGAYALKLSFGGQSQKLSVSVAAGDTNADVLQAVADAVNGSTLQVDASVRSQTGSNPLGYGILGPGVIPTGSFLTLSVNADRAGSSPTLTDASGHLAAALDLSAASVPSSPAQTGTHQVTSLSVARPTTFRTGGFDSEAVTTLSPGTYTLSYAAGPASGSVVEGSVDVTVNAGDTWGEVLAHMKSAFGSASAFMVSQLVSAKRVWDSTTDELHAVVDATGLEVALNDPKPGWRLSLSGGDNASGAGNILSALGLNVTAQPGSDGSMIVDGRERTSATSAYTADQGRVALNQSGTFGEAVPVSVLAPLETLSRGLSDVVTAYNGLRDILTRNADLLRTDLAEDWRTPVSDRAGDLSDLGLVESGAGKALWLNADTFVQALTDNAQAVRATLLGDGSDTGLLPELAQMAQDALDSGAGGLLLPQSAFARRDPFLASPTPRTEAEIEKAGQLLDLLDSAPKIGADPAAGSSTGLASGISSGIGPEALSWGTGGVLRRKG